MLWPKQNFIFGGNYFARGEFVLYINHSGKYIEINFNMKIPYTCFSGKNKKINSAILAV